MKKCDRIKYSDTLLPYFYEKLELKNFINSFYENFPSTVNIHNCLFPVTCC